MTERDHPDVDPERRPTSAFDVADGYSGQDYRREREEEERRRDPSGRVNPGLALDQRHPTPPTDADIPPENGRRAWVDPASGAVHGAGSGDGGGAAGEDYDSDPEAGSGYPATGVAGETAAREAAEEPPSPPSR